MLGVAARRQTWLLHNKRHVQYMLTFQVVVAIAIQVLVKQTFAVVSGQHDCQIIRQPVRAQLIKKIPQLIIKRREILFIQSADVAVSGGRRTTICVVGVAPIPGELRCRALRQKDSIIRVARFQRNVQVTQRQ